MKKTPHWLKSHRIISAVKWALAACLLNLSTISYAMSQDTRAEIDKLLNHVEQSECTFIRNGSEHPAAKARAHLELKLDRGSKYVNSTEDFIDRLATKSSWTGKAYQIRCPSDSGSTVTVTSADWFYGVLKDIRQAS